MLSSGRSGREDSEKKDVSIFQVLLCSYWLHCQGEYCECQESVLLNRMLEHKDSVHDHKDS